MLYIWQIIAVYSESDTKHINKLVKKVQSFWTITVVCTYDYM